MAAVENWVNEEYFKSTLIQDYGETYKITRFKAIPAFGCGENYGSEMLRVEIDLEFLDKSTQSASYILKSLPKNGQGAEMLVKLNVFPKEIEIYELILPKLEKIFEENGRTVTFGPKCCKTSSQPEAILMEDLKMKSFKNAKRQDGLNIEHTKCALKKLAEFHAASACIYEKYGKYSEMFENGLFNEDNREIYDTMAKSMAETYRVCMMKWPNGFKYVKKMEILQDQLTDRLIDDAIIDRNDFNVLNHGDFWCNNIMFQYNDDGSIKETYFIDYQGSKYGSPAQDLYYFLISSACLDIKIKKFDYLIKFYHDQLIENLKFLKYPKELPTLSYLHIMLLKKGIWGIATATGVLTAALLDPCENACIENFVESNNEALAFRLEIYANQRYVDVMEELLPWLDNRGLLE